MNRIAQIEADVIVLEHQLAAEAETVKLILARVSEIKNELEEIRTQERQAREQRGLYGRLASVATLQIEFPEVNVRSLINRAHTNGLATALVRPHGKNQNGRVLIDRDRFNAWLETKRATR